MIIKKFKRFANPVVFCDIIYNNFRHLPSKQHNIGEIRRLLMDQHFIGFGLYDGELIVGYIVGEFKMLGDGRHCLYISYLFIGKMFRKRGLSTLLLNEMVKYCRGNECKFIVLSCGDELVGYYKKYGFMIDKFVEDKYDGQQIMVMNT